MSSRRWFSTGAAVSASWPTGAVFACSSRRGWITSGWPRCIGSTRGARACCGRWRRRQPTIPGCGTISMRCYTGGRPGIPMTGRGYSMICRRSARWGSVSSSFSRSGLLLAMRPNGGQPTTASSGWQSLLLETPVPGGWETLTGLADAVHQRGCSIQGFIAPRSQEPEGPDYDEDRWPRDAGGQPIHDLSAHDAVERLRRGLDHLGGAGAEAGHALLRRLRGVRCAGGGLLAAAPGHAAHDI